MNKEPVKSPCVSICTIDEDTGWCRGCRRTRNEIARWMTCSESERIAVLEDIETRQG